MGFSSKEVIDWDNGVPTQLSKSLIGMKIRKQFYVEDSKEWKYFTGEVISYLNKKQYEVRYEDGEVLREDEKDVVKYLFYTF